MRAFLIVALVVAVLVGGLLTLRASTRTGMPDEEVLRRAQRRADERRRAGEQRGGDEP